MPDPKPTISTWSDEAMVHITDVDMQVWSSGTVVLSMAPGQSTQDQTWITVDPTKDLSVYALTVKIDGSIALNGIDGTGPGVAGTAGQGRALSIVAQTVVPDGKAAIACHGGKAFVASTAPLPTPGTPGKAANGHAYTFSTDDGGPGASGGNGAQGAAGGDGGKGGSISIVTDGFQGGADSITFDVSGTPGTVGGPGGNAGNGGDGGDGASIYVGDQFSGHLNIAAAGPGGPSGLIGYGGQGGTGGTGGTVNLQVRGATSLFPADPTTWQAGQAAIAYGAGANAGANGLPGQGGWSGEPADSDNKYQATQTLGYNGTQPVNPAASGKTGTLVAQANVPGDQLRASYPASWLNMVVNRARAAFFHAYLADAGDPVAEDLQTVDALLDWLSGVLGPTPPADAGLAAAWTATAHLNLMRSRGLNVFGRTSASVPLQFWQSLADDAQQVSDLYFTTLGQFNALFQAEVKEGDHATSLTAQQNSAKSQSATLTTKNQALEPQLGKLVTRINDDEARQYGALTAFEKAIEHLDQSIELSFNFQLSDVVSAFSQMCFIPMKESPEKGAPEEWSKAGVANAALQGAGLLDNATTKVTMKDGTVIDKSALITSMDTYAGQIDGLHEAWKAMHGFVLPDDPNCAKLKVAAGQLDQLLENLPSQIDTGEVKTALHVYVAACQVLNKDLLAYNAKLEEWLVNAAKIITLDQLVAEIQAKLAQEGDSDPTAPELLASSATLVEVLRNSLLDLLDLVARSYRFYRLEDQVDVIKLLGAGPDIDQASVNATLLELKVGDDLDDVFGGQHPWEEFPALIQGRGASLGPGATWVLTDDEVGQLRTDQSVMITIPRLASDSLGSQLMQGYANYRVSVVVPWVVGVQTQTGLVTVMLRHLGVGDQFQTADTGDVFAFDHDQVEVAASYPCSSAPPHDVDTATYATVLTGRNTEIPSLPNLANGPVDKLTQHQYTGVGPFSTWELSISSTVNLGLDLSGVTSVWLDIQGINQAANESQNPSPDSPDSPDSPASSGGAA